MLTRRVLFKMLAAIGVGSLLPAVGKGGIARFSEIDEAQFFSSTARSGGSRATLPE